MIFENEKILSNPSLSSLLEGKTGMTAPKQSRQKQRVVIQFLLSERETAWNISRRLKQVYGDGAIDYSTVTRWVKRINDGREEPAESNLCDGPRSGRPSSTHSSANIDQADAVESKNTKSLTCLEMSKVLLQHDNGRPHTSLKTREVISSFGWTRISHPPYSPDLAPSDFHLFWAPQRKFEGRHFSSDEEVKTAVRKWLKTQPVEFYNEGMCTR